MSMIKKNLADRFQTIHCMKTHLPSNKNIEFNVKKCMINCLDLWITIYYDSCTNSKIDHPIFQKEFNTYTYVHRASIHDRMYKISM